MVVNMVVNDRVFSEDEMNVLSTAVANLVNTRSLCKVMVDPYNKEKTKYRILCSDGKKRRMKQKDIVGLIEKVAFCSGFDISEESKGVLRGAGL